MSDLRLVRSYERSRVRVCLVRCVALSRVRALCQQPHDQAEGPLRQLPVNEMSRFIFLPVKYLNMHARENMYRGFQDGRIDHDRTLRIHTYLVVLYSSTYY